MRMERMLKRRCGVIAFAAIVILLGLAIGMVALPRTGARAAVVSGHGDGTLWENEYGL